MNVNILTGDCRDLLSTMEAGSVQTCVTSPPYFNLRDYGMDGQVGREETPDGFIAALVAVFRAVRRVLRDDGTLWLNLGDSYGTGKNLLMMPARTAIALQADGWVLRSEIVWHKPNCMPDAAKDRPTRSHEYLYLLAKSPSYHYDASAIAEPFADERMGNPGGGTRHYAPGDRNDATDSRMLLWNADGAIKGRNRRTVWTVASQPFKGAHFATFPPKLIEPCILAGSRAGDTVLDPFGGAGTTGLVAARLGRNAILCELNPAYADLARARLAADAPTQLAMEVA